MKESIKEAAKSFIRVGDDYYKITYEPDKKKVLHRKLVKRSKTTITDDYGRNIIHEIKKFEGFVMIPSHFDYEQVVYEHYNKYHEIPHQPKKGKYNTIINYLTHVFGVNYLDFILDYLQIMYLRPTQNLPIILLESEEKNTGKSTFCDLLRAIFEFNCMSISSNDLDNTFNSVWIEKLIIVVEETSENRDGVMQMIKNLTGKNDGSVLSNAKGKDQVEKEFIGKFVFTSNKVGKALPIEKKEDRFAVFKVPTFEENNIERDPDIMTKLKSEIPAFLYFLINRELYYERKDRMYFDKSVYFTEQLKLYFEGSNSDTTRAIKDLIIDTFEAFPDESILCFSVINIITELSSSFLRFTDRRKIKESLENELGMKPMKKGRYTYFSLHLSEVDESYFPSNNNNNNVHYQFERKDYFDESLNSTNGLFPKVEQMAVF